MVYQLEHLLEGGAFLLHQETVEVNHSLELLETTDILRLGLEEKSVHMFAERNNSSRIDLVA